jgi:Trypsin/Carbohydrate-binding module family 5/12
MRARRLLCATVGAIVTAGLVNAPPAHAGNVRPDIIGGTTVSSAPWAVQVSSSGAFCSGSIMAPQWVLTAAHCTSGNMSVKVGDVRLNSGQNARVTQNYTNGDTALLHLDHAINTGYVQLADSDPPVGAITDIYGWGATCDQGCGLSPVLKTATVRVTGFSSGPEGRMIEATWSSGIAHPGDSGGPMFYQGRQIGTCTGGAGLDVGYPSIANVIGWIRQVTGTGGGGGGGGGGNPPPGTGTWQPWVSYAVGAQVTYNGQRYRAVQAHTSQPGWEPPNVPALWQPV